MERCTEIRAAQATAHWPLVDDHCGACRVQRCEGGGTNVSK